MAACIFDAPRGEKVRVFRLANVVKVLYIMHGFDISLFSLELASEGDFGRENCQFWCHLATIWTPLGAKVSIQTHRGNTFCALGPPLCFFIDFS